MLSGNSERQHFVVYSLPEKIPSPAGRFEENIWGLRMGGPGSEDKSGDLNLGGEF